MDISLEVILADSLAIGYIKAFMLNLMTDTFFNVSWKIYAFRST
jgi:hypothetical protein